MMNECKVIIKEICGKEFSISIANSNIIDGIDFHYQTQDDRIFGSGYIWGTPVKDLEKPEIDALIDLIERDLMNRRDITLEKKYVITEVL